MSKITRGDEILLKLNGNIIRATVNNCYGGFLYTDAGCHAMNRTDYVKIESLTKEYFD